MVRLKNVATSHALQGFIDLMELPKNKVDKNNRK